MADGFKELSGLDRIVHEPARLVLMALLYPLDSADFLYLLRESGLTKGNLSAHLAKLEEAGYVAVEKGYRGKIPQTTYSLTWGGREALRAYRATMRRAVERLPD